MRRIPLPEALSSAIEIHQLELELDEEPHRAWTLLTPAEQAVGERYRFCADRVRFAATRAAARVLLARRLDCPPQGVDIAVGRHRKPEVRGVKGRSLAGAPLFNVSHSGRFALVAVGDAGRLESLGIDIERCDPSIDPFSIAEVGCTPGEWACLRSAQIPQDVLYPIWVAKEAALKAVGVGIPDHLLSVSIELRPGAEIGVQTLVGAWRGLQARSLDAPDGYVAALAWRSKEEIVQ